MYVSRVDSSLPAAISSQEILGGVVVEVERRGEELLNCGSFSLSRQDMGQGRKQPKAWIAFIKSTSLFCT